jgi:hypothetical protein
MNTKRFASTLGVFTTSFLFMAIAGCSASDNGPNNGTGGTSGAGTGGGTGTTATGGSSGGTPSATQLTFDSGGFVASSTMTKGVQGAFYAYGDGQGATASIMGTCQTAGITPCSTIVMTIDALGQKICATGTAAAVPTMNDYSAVFGAGVGFDLNNGGIEAGGGKLPYNATANSVTGVGFTLEGATDNYGMDFRIEFPAQGQDSIGTNAPARYDTILPGSTNVEAKFADATVGYAMDGIPVTTSAVLSFQWHVATKLAVPIPFNFCLTNIHLLTN